MKANQNIEQRLQTLGQSLGHDETLIEAIMTRIEAETEKPNENRPPAEGLLRRILMNRYVQLAAAVIIIAAVLTAATMLAGPEQEQKPIAHENTNQQTDNAAVPQPQLADAPRQQKLTEELAQAEAMFAAKDIPGLISLLQTGQYETKVAAANYLAQIGDLTAAEALAKLAAQFPDLKPNPFADAALKIAERLSAQTPPAQNAKASEDENKPASIADVRSIYFSGTITDTNNVPIPNVTVTSEWISLAGAYAIESSVLTGKDGTFRIGPLKPLPDSQNINARVLFFDHPEYGLAAHHPSANSPVSNITITLESPSVVAGIVKDVRGKPVRGARVQASVKTADNKDILLWELNGRAAYTDVNGWFAFAGIPAGAKVSLVADHKTTGYFATDPGFGSASIEAGNEQVEITLNPGACVRGRLVLDGKPYEKKGIIIVARGEQRLEEATFAYTDETGRFETGGLPAGTYSIAPMYEDFLSDEVVCEPLQDVQVAADGSPTEVTMVVSRGVEFSIKILDESTGHPVKGIGVRIMLPDRQTPAISGSLTTDEAGTLKCRLNPGDYVVLVSGWKDGRYKEFARDIHLETRKPSQIFELAVAQRDIICGWLVDSNNNPIEGTVSIGIDRFYDSNSAGAFSLPYPDWTPGNFERGYAFDKNGTLGKVFFWQHTNEPNDLQIVLEPMATIIGRLVDANGKGIGGITPVLWIVYPHGSSTTIRKDIVKTTIDRKGNFRFDNVPAGVAMEVFVTKPGHQGRTEPFELQPAQTLDVGNVVMEPLPGFEEPVEWNGVLNGRVTDESDKPVSGVTVQASIGMDHFEDKTDAKGRYRLTGLPKGKKISGSVYLDGYGHTMFTTVVDGNDLGIQLLPQGWRLLGQQAPQLSVAKWLNSEPVTLEQLRGSVVLLQIGAYLPHYGSEFDLMEEMLNKYTDKGLKIVIIHEPLSTTWGGKVTEQDITKFIEDHDIHMPFAIDSPPSNGETYSLYDVKVTPARYLVDKNGILRTSPTRKNLEEWIKKLLAE